MVPALISLALVANSYQPPRVAIPKDDRVVTATVTIMAAEEIRFGADERKARGQTRQYRTRNGMPLVEFY
jgi:hypothetical protein